MTTFLLVYSQPNIVFGTGPWEQDTIASAIAEHAPGVEGVYSLFENSLCIRCTSTVRQLYEFVKERFRGLEFLLVEVGDVRAGSMHPSFWNFLREKAPASAAE